MTRTLRPARALLALVLLAATGWLLYRWGGPDGARSVPLDSWADFQEWADDTPTPLMASAVVRLAGLVTAIYGASAVTVALVADVLRCKVLARAALAATPAAFRRLLGGSVARVGLAAGAVLAPAIGATSPASAMPVEPPEQPTATMTRLEAEPLAVATMVRLGPVQPPVPAPPVSIPTSPAAAPIPTTPTPSPVDDSRVVEPGDSFWSIAEEAVGAGGDVSQYWQTLIATNRGRLVAPDCPDLLIPGQTLVLPAT